MSLLQPNRNLFGKNPPKNRHQQETPMDYHLTHARRKTLTLTVRPDGTVEVRAPLKLSRTIIDGFLEEKAA